MLMSRRPRGCGGCSQSSEDGPSPAENCVDTSMPSRRRRLLPMKRGAGRMIRSIAQFRWNLGATFLVLPVLSVLWAGSNQGSTQPETDAVRQVRSVLERQEADWNRGDLD